MALNQPFWQPWSEIDPDGAHGGIAGELDDFVAPRLGDNPTTKNVDVRAIFQVTQETAAALSMHPEANVEGPPRRAIVEEVLRGCNLIFERILDRTRSTATTFFSWTHATPPFLDFSLRPIRFPLRSPWANEIVYFFLGTLVEVAEANANGMHSCLDPSSSHRIIQPLFHMKSNIIRDMFDQEVVGEITQDELNKLYAGLTRPGPTIVPPSESAPVAEGEDVSEALEGVDVLQWYPTTDHWTLFGKKFSEQFKAERIWQPEGSSATTEDVAPEQPTPPLRSDGSVG